MYNRVCNVLSDYPNLPTPFVSSVCCFEKDGSKYLLMKSNGVNITGRRLAGGQAEYYYDGTAYAVRNGELIETDSDVIGVTDTVRAGGCLSFGR